MVGLDVGEQGRWMMEVAQGVWLGPQLGVETQTTCNDRGRRLGDEKKGNQYF